MLARFDGTQAALGKLSMALRQALALRKALDKDSCHQMSPFHQALPAHALEFVGITNNSSMRRCIQRSIWKLNSFL